MPARQRIERTGIHGDYHVAPPVITQTGWQRCDAHAAAEMGMRRLCGAPPRMERALFIIFAPQQMIVNRTGLAVLHDLPAGERVVRGRIELRPVSTYSAPPAATSGAASAIARSSAARSSNGGSRNTTSNAPGVSRPRAAARPPRQPRPHARRACPDRTQLLRGARMALDHHDARRAARRRLETECAGAREQVEATPAFEILPSQLNSVSRTRSGVGRRPSRSSTASGVRFQSPPMMRIVCGLPRPEGPPGGRERNGTYGISTTEGPGARGAHR